MLTIKELKNIFDKENINSHAYSFQGNSMPLLESVYFMQKNKNNEFEIYFQERDEVEKIATFVGESEACAFFLLKMSGGFSKLRKYLPQYWQYCVKAS